MNTISRFAKYTWFLLSYNLLVILWGAFVRATGSGAGCGSHWPLCNGEVIPRASQIETVIEFTHRLSSGLSFIFVIVLFIWAFLIFPVGDRIRKGATASLILIILEALFGAGLVLFKWVAGDDSLGRTISMPTHLIVTFLLLMVLALTAWWASGRKGLTLKGCGLPAWGWITGLIGVLIIGMTGAVTALGDTIFPAETLAEGLRQDLSAQAHFLIHLRIWHPMISVLVGFFLIAYAYFFGFSHSKPTAQKLSRGLILLVLLQWSAGLINVAMLAPVWMQLVHLFLADLTWIVLVLFGAAAFET